MGICILIVLVSLVVASEETATFASSPVGSPAAVIVEGRCPSCGVGYLQTIWRSGRPGPVERQFIARMYLKRASLFYRHPLRRGSVPDAPRGAPAARGRPLTRVTIGSIPRIRRLARDLPPPSRYDCTKLALTSSSSRWWRRLSLDTIPQVGSARATRRSTGRRHLGTRRPVLSNGPLFHGDHSPWCCAAR
jgi:hypothetical protein